MIPFLADYFKVWLDEDAMKEFIINGFFTAKFHSNEKVYDKIKSDCNKHRGLLQY